MIKKYIKQNEVLNKIQKNENIIIDKFSLKICNKNEIILKENTKIEKIIILVEGLMQSQKSKKILTPGSIIGEEILLLRDKDKVISNESFSMLIEGVIFYINITDLEIVLGSTYYEFLMKNENKHEVNIFK